MSLLEELLGADAIAKDPIARELAVVMTLPTRRTARGHPYLQEPAWTRLRDWVPHILDDGPRVLAACARVADAAAERGAALEDAAQVVRQVVLSAAVTAPPDLWLLRHVLAACHESGLSARLLHGEVIHPSTEQQIDLRFLLSRGLVRLAGDGFHRADHDAAIDAFTHTRALTSPETSAAEMWRAVLEGRASTTERAALAHMMSAPPPPDVRAPGWFAPGASAIERGARLVPLVLGLRAADRIPALLAAGRVDAGDICDDSDDALGAHAIATLASVGAIDASGALTVVGRRVLERGPGPFGIIEAYQPYMHKLAAIWSRGRGAVWVERGKNVAASQDANRATFEAANDALDRFCADTGFSYGVFIEHALGKGEATRQRAARSPTLRFVGADLEDAAIDAAITERDRGRLPADMLFVRDADIGKPDVLLRALADAGVSADGAVMIVGNGFHEVREQTDARMTEVFRGYAQAGIVLLFTEETGLSVEDLLATAWNTYHAGFKYVHERSGQGLRPADERVASALDHALPASWRHCAEQGGYVRVDAYSPRGRTAYPYTPASGHNPSISVTHFCVPAALWQTLEGALSTRSPRA